MVKKKQGMSETEWSKKVANKYGIFPSTVIHICHNLVGKTYRHGKYLDRRKRTEEFFELYFEGMKEGR